MADESGEYTYGSVTDGLIASLEESIAHIEAALELPAIGKEAGKLRKLADKERAFLKEQKARQAYLAENPDIANRRIE